MHAGVARNFPQVSLQPSTIGEECERQLWMSWRWFAEAKPANGQRQKIYARGTREEDRILDDIRSVGWTVSSADPSTGRQWSFTLANGHMKGFIDGAAQDETGKWLQPKTWALVECKTHKADSWRATVKHGVRKAHPKHHAQMMISMGALELTVALYAARNKDTEEDHFARIDFDKAEYDRLVAKAERIVAAGDPPLPISIDPTFYKCRMCSQSDVCHKRTRAPRSCRTCVFSSTASEGRWLCGKTGNYLDLPAQRAGCHMHRHFRDFIDGTPVVADYNLEVVKYITPAGEFIDNGVS